MEINSIASEIKTKHSPSAQYGKAGKEFAQRLERAVALSDNSAADETKLKQTCRDMEAVFLNLMLSQMRSTVPKTSLMGDTGKEEMMRSMLDSEMTKNLSQAGGIGLADMIYRQLSTSAKLKSQAPR